MKHIGFQTMMVNGVISNYSRVQTLDIYPGLTGTFSSNVTAGNVVIINYSCSGLDSPTISDNLGNTWHQVYTVNSANPTTGNTTNLTSWYCQVNTTGTMTVTLTTIGADNGFCGIEYAGFVGSATLESSGSNRLTNTNDLQTTWITSAANSLLCCYAADEQIIFTGVTADNGFNLVLTNNSHAHIYSDLVNQPAGTYTTGFTKATTSDTTIILGFALTG